MIIFTLMGYFHKVTFKAIFLGNRGPSVVAVESRVLGLRGEIAGESVEAEPLLS